MTLTLDTTIGGAAANSYVSQATATAYLEGRLNSSAWTNATSGNRDIALVEAFREINTRAFEGRKVSSTQAGQFPRQWLPDPDAITGTYYDTTVIPQRVQDAQCELALEFLRAGTTDLAALPDSDGVIEKTVDVLTTRWADPAQRARGLARYPRILALLAPLFAAQGSQIVRG